MVLEAALLLTQSWNIFFMFNNKMSSDCRQQPSVFGTKTEVYVDVWVVKAGETTGCTLSSTGSGQFLASFFQIMTESSNL